MSRICSVLKKVVIVVYCALILSYTSSAQAQRCETNRVILEETENYFHVAAKYKYGTDSLERMISQKLQNLLLVDGETGVNSFLLLVSIDREGAISSIEPQIEQEHVNAILERFDFLLGQRDWCLEYLILKRKRTKEFLIPSSFAIHVRTVNGKYIGLNVSSP